MQGNNGGQTGMIITLTPAQAELLNDILAMQLQIENEHLDNCLDSISKHNTRNIIKRMQTIKAKLEQNNE
jgi:hypothetical protein